MPHKTPKVIACVGVPYIAGFAAAETRNGHRIWIWEFAGALGFIALIVILLWLEANVSD